MDLRLGLSLLLLLAYASGALCRTTRHGPRISPRHHQHQFHVQRRSDRVLQRPVRALSEFLEPPPLPSNYRQSRGSPPPPPSPLANYHQRKPSNNNNVNHKQAALLSPSPPPQGKQVRNGRYANPQNSGQGYLNKLVNLLNPFGAGGNADTKDSHSQGSSNFPQYAPQMPYNGGNNQYGPPPHPPSPPTGGFSGLSAWMQGKNCNPCNEFPWVPVIRNDVNPYQGQYAANSGSNNYLAPPPPQQSHAPDPHLFSGPMPPLFKAKPFHDSPRTYLPPSLEQPPPPVFHQPPPAANHQQTPSNFDHQPAPSNFDSQPVYDHQPQQNFDQSHQPQGNFNPEHQQSFDQPQGNFNHEHQQSFDHPPQQNFDQPQGNFNHEHQQSFDHQPQTTNNQHFHIDVQESPVIDIDSPPPDFGPSSNFDYQPPENYDNQPPTYDEQPPSNFEPQHQPTQNVDVIKDAPYDLNVEINNHQEPDHAESRPVFINSAASSTVIPVYYPTTTMPSASKHDSRGGSTNIHFQRSPLIDLSVAGETAPASNRLPTKTKADRDSSTVTTVPSATVIDYIVSGPRETSREETRPTTTTTTQRATTIAADQKQQESRIETLVQSYEFYKKRNDTKHNETKNAGRLYNDNEDFSASREAVAPSKSDNGKKIIQIIIPYTSQYTPSPFHPTKSVKRANHTSNHRVEETTLHAEVEIDSTDGSVEDNVVIQESRRVSVTRAPEPALRNNQTGHTIDVHRLQKNIDNWTIQEYSKKASAVRNSINSTYPRWISSKQIPDEYLLAATEEDSNEYYDFSHETQLHRGINKLQVTTTTPAPTTTSTEATTKVNIVNATYPKSTKKPEYPPKPPNPSTKTTEKVYVVTPIPNPNSLEVFSTDKDHEGRFKPRRPKVKQDKVSVEQAYQVLPQAVNNLAVLANAPESAAPALWGIMEHEQIASSPNQPRWRSESDVLPEPPSTPILYSGHSKVSRAR